jgi:ornithine decarboxylase
LSPRIRQFLARLGPPTPCLVIDLGVVRRSYQALTAALPAATVHYAVKANPAPQVLRLLVRLGAAFDVASPGEVSLCLAAGAPPAAICYGSTIKKRSDVSFAYAAGVRLFAVDSLPDLLNIAEVAPGAQVYCRLAVPDDGSLTPFRGKFGCAPGEAVELLGRAGPLGLEPRGVSFHVGSQQLHPEAFVRGIAAAATVLSELRLELLNLGGGLPVSYKEPVPPLAAFASAITDAVADVFDQPPRLMIEPGRAVVAAAGVLRTEVVLVAHRAGRRWVYLDVGRYGGLAETENEAIVYRIESALEGDRGACGPVVLAGPTCDGDDVLYQRSEYRLPLALGAGDQLDILAAGAYTASYASVGFNGFGPVPTYCLDDDSG